MNAALWAESLRPTPLEHRLLTQRPVLNEAASLACCPCWQRTCIG